MSEHVSHPGKPRLSALDTSVPHRARVWNYWLGGRDHFAVDRAAGDRFGELFPAIREHALAIRYFLVRAVRYLAAEAGVRQFVDIGTGLPTVDHTHEIAQRAAPGARVVYVDSDPLVLAHARALLTSSADGATDYLDADLRDTAAILHGAGRTLDLGQPVAVLLCAALGHLDDASAPGAVRRLMAALPPGSHLLVCDGSDTSPKLNRAQRLHHASGATVYRLRSPAELRGYFDGLDLIAPGLVPCPQWRPDPDPFRSTEVHAYGGVGRKPTGSPLPPG